MKRILYLMILLAVSCKISRISAYNEDTIVHLMQSNVETLLRKELKSVKNDVFFELTQNDSLYKITMITIKQSDVFANRSNRKLFIDGKFYPLIFDFDVDFGITDSSKDVAKKFKENTNFNFTRRLTLNHHNFYI
jgi:hypothetical protein